VLSLLNAQHLSVYAVSCTVLQKGEISIAHIADGIQKQSKTFYQLYI
jgi:hypothetical protein